jgi:hypothetical protein
MVFIFVAGSTNRPSSTNASFNSRLGHQEIGLEFLLIAAGKAGNEAPASASSFRDHGRLKIEKQESDFSKFEAECLVAGNFQAREDELVSLLIPVNSFF